MNLLNHAIGQWILNAHEDTLRNITIVGIVIALIGATHDYLNSARRLIRSALTITITMLLTTIFCIVLLLIPILFFWRFHFMDDIWPGVLLTCLILAGMVGTFHGVFILFSAVESREVSQNKLASSHTLLDEKQNILKPETLGVASSDQHTDQFSTATPKEASLVGSKKRSIRKRLKGSWQGAIIGFILGGFCLCFYSLLIIFIFVKPTVNDYDTTSFRILEVFFFGIGAILGCVWRGWICRPIPTEKSFWKHLYQFSSSFFTRGSGCMKRFFKWLKTYPVQQILPILIKYPVNQIVSWAIVRPWHHLTKPPAGEIALANVKDTIGQPQVEPGVENDSAPSKSPVPSRPIFFSPKDSRTGIVFWLIIALVLYGLTAIGFGISVVTGYSPSLYDAGMFLMIAIVMGVFVLTGGFASGIAFSIHWATHFSKRIGKIGIFFTIISLLLTAIEPSVLEAKSSLISQPQVTFLDSSTPQPQDVTPTRTPLPSTFTYYTYTYFSTVNAIAWSPDGKRIASASDDGTVRIWNAFTGSNILTYNKHTAEVTAIAWSPDGKYIASASADKTVQVWNATTMKTLTIYRGHSSAVDTIAWSPDGKRIASAGGDPDNPGSGDNSVQIWNVATSKLLYKYRGHSEWVKTVAWSPDGKYIASGGYDRTVQVWNASTGRHLYTYRGHLDRVYTVAWSPDGKRIASAGGDPNIDNADNTVQIWDAFTGSHLFTYNGHIYDVNSVSWSPNGRYIASASDSVQVWDADTGELIFTYHGHDTGPNVLSVEWSPDGKYIASGGYDRTVQVWYAPVA